MPDDDSATPPADHRPGTLLSNIMAMLTASVVSQVIAVTAAPLLTRVYSPREFAGLAMFMAAANLLMVVTTLRYELGVVLARRDKTAALLSAFTLALITCVAGVLSASVLLLGYRQELLSRLPLGASLLAMLPLQVFLLGFCSLATRFHMRRNHFRLIATVELAVSVITLATQIGLGFFVGASAVLLVACVMVGRAIVAVTLGAALVRFIVAHRRNCNRQTLAAVAKHFRRFPMFTTFSELAGQSTTEAPKLLLGALFPVHVLGIFSLATRILEKPISLANLSVQQAFYKFTADNRHQPHEVRVHLLRITRYLACAVAVPAVVLLVWAEPMFEFAFGSQWREAGQYARLLIPMLVVRFTILPTCWALFALEKQHVVLMWNVAHLGQAIVALTIGGLLGNAQLAILAFSLTSAAMYGALFMTTLYYVSQPSGESEDSEIIIRREAA